MKKRILSMVLAAAMALMLMPTTALPVNAGATGAKALTLGTSGIIAGDKVYYGNYSSSDINWRVLSKTGNGGTYDVTGASPMFLISENTLEIINFDNDGLANSGQTNPNEWQGSDARQWCTTFYNVSNFTADEKKAILATTKNDGAISVNGSVYDTSSLSADNVFFLSAQEAYTYFENDDDRMTNGGAVGWWLRSPYDYSTNYAGVVLEDGWASSNTVNYLYAARPAFNLNQTSVLFSSAATGGKSATGMDSGLTAVSTETPTDWKLTLKDSNHTLATATTTNAMTENSTITVKYTGATEGTTISGVIVDDSDNILYYGNLVSASNNTTDKNTVSVTLPNGFNSSTMTLKLFTETLNGNFKTDYASDFVDVTFTEASAVVGNVTVSGTAGTAITETDVTLTITNDTFKAISADTNVSAWFTNLPTELSAKVKTAVTAGDTTATITISGTPTAENSAAMAITIPATALTGGAEITATTNANAKWSIAAAPVAPTITTTSLPSGTVGTLYNQTLQATGDATITWSLKTSSVLPAGLSLSTTGVISGTPTTAGATSFTVVASNGVNPNAEKQLSITIAAPVTPPTGGGSTSGGSTTKAYHFTKGANGEWESTSDEGLEFTVDGAYSNFLRAEVDGKIINKGTDYTVKSGSTIITLTPEYLKTLDAGTHKLTAVYRDGSVTTSFKVILFDDLAAGAGIEGEEETLPDDDTPTDADAKPQDDKPAETTSSDENPATGNSLSGVFAVAILAITAVGIAYKKRRK